MTDFNRGHVLAVPSPRLEASDIEKAAIARYRPPTTEQSAANVAAIERDAAKIQARRDEEAPKPVSAAVAEIILAMKDLRNQS